PYSAGPRLTVSSSRENGVILGTKAISKRSYYGSRTAPLLTRPRFAVCTARRYLGPTSSLEVLYGNCSDSVDGLECAGRSYCRTRHLQSVQVSCPLPVPMGLGGSCRIAARSIQGLRPRHSTSCRGGYPSRAIMRFLRG